MSEGLLDAVNKRFSDLPKEDDAAFDEKVEYELTGFIRFSDVSWQGSNKVITVPLRFVKINLDRTCSMSIMAFNNSIDRVSCGLEKRAGNLSIARHGDLLMITLLHNTIKSDVQQPTVTTPISNAPSNPKTHAPNVATMPWPVTPTPPVGVCVYPYRLR